MSLLQSRPVTSRDAPATRRDGAAPVYVNSDSPMLGSAGAARWRRRLRRRQRRRCRRQRRHRAAVRRCRRACRRRDRSARREAEPDGLHEPDRPEEDGGVRHPVRGQQPALVRRRRQAARPGAARPAARFTSRTARPRRPSARRARADDGKWVFPVGTVMVKSFLFDGKLVETRLFVHFDADHLGWLHATSGTRRRPTRRSSPTSASRCRSTPASGR